MVTIASEPEQRVVLRNIDWETYERLLESREEDQTPRLAYDRGWLEIVSALLSLHEQIKYNVEVLVEALTSELGIDVEGRGSTTLKREDLQAGVEPDCCFYIQHAAHVRGKARIDMMVDPPPDLAVEVDISHRTLDKLPIYARFGVPEVWHYHRQQWAIWVLEGDQYRAAAESAVLPGLTPDALEALLARREELGSARWQRYVRTWAGNLRGASSE